MRKNILEITLVLGCVCFASLSLYQSTAWHEIGFVNLTYFFVLVALVMGIGRMGSKRAFWLGFLVASAGSLGISIFDDSRLDLEPPDAKYQFTSWAMYQLHPEFIDEYEAIRARRGVGGVFCLQDGLSSRPDFEELSELIKSTIDPDSWEDTQSPTLFPAQGVGFTITSDDTEVADVTFGPSAVHFLSISYSIWALFLGWIVGHACKFKFKHSERKSNFDDKD